MQINVDITGTEAQAEIALGDILESLNARRDIEVVKISRMTVGDRHTIHAVLG
jgi:hypothetical protein